MSMASADFLNQIMQFVENKLGLKPQSLNLLTWEWVLKERMTLCNLLTYEEYYKRLKISSHELQELIELIIVPETWFFRDKSGFDFLVHFVKEKEKEWSFFKIMSLPCSTGEEPYSIVMALFDHGINKRAFSVDALDISKKALAKAEMGLYRKNSFRGKDLSFRDRYFDKINNQYAIRNFIKEQVHFYSGNILSSRMPFNPQSYHFIFCRNLLIYLDEQAQKRTLDFLQNLLIPNGILLVGPVETQIARRAGFIPLSFTRANAFHWKEKGLFPLEEQRNYTVLLKDQPKLKGKETGERPFNLVSPLSFQAEDKIDLKNTEKKELDKAALLAQAIKLADEGSFETSIDLCMKYIALYGAQTEVYYLLGLIQHAMGNEGEAEKFFHKTVYLKPLHYEALIYLALLYEKKGDLTKAERFRKRAQKAYKT
ncbi:CheR family methyltransferase [Candidatus Protochlamydia phocaeensis]|uniref:CheR family methyltransferase n=1 Tax=Candidatus Protochlamydia phocaeensis TaxID=1414722 RepID=UPI0008399594|nr:CheR family methyltransferase [Candidatus Protochlamydia phocaeensis]